MPPNAAVYQKYKKIKAERDRMNGQIFDTKRKKTMLEIQRDDLSRIAKLPRER